MTKTKKACLIACAACFALLLVLCYCEIRWPEAGSELVRGMFAAGE